MSTAERVRPASSLRGREPQGREPRRQARLLDVAIGVVGEVLVTLGVLVLAFLAWQLWWTDVVADGEQAQAVSGLEQRFAASTASTAPEVTAQVGQAFATIRIPRFGADYVRPVIEGTAKAQIDAGVGHSPGTAMPGRVGNFATAGHRVTYGKPYNLIHTLRPGDAIVVETAAGWSVYRYQRHRIVTPDQTEVLAPVPDRPGVAPTQAWMTLVACHPPFSARERYVGYALLERFVPRDEGPPTDALAAPAGVTNETE